MKGGEEMTTERALKRWRKEALMMKEDPDPDNVYEQELAERILRLTQELLDQYLIRK